MHRSRRVSAMVCLVGAGIGVPVCAQQTVEERLKRLEDQNAALQRRVDELADQNEAMSLELERFEFRDVIPPVGESQHGLGPAASKVYDASGLSIGGYGEYLFQQRSGNTDVFDALRAVLYVGYKFDEQFVFNSEIEIEHGTTSSSSGTTSSSGSVSLEFGYLDWLASEPINVRAGLLLVPMGLINEMHEPTTFLTANRPQTETRVLPTTWRAGGAGVFGDAGGFSYRAYVVNSLDGERFDSGGLRDGRQKGSRAAADDVAFVGRLDWVDTPGLLIGGSVFVGHTGQDGIDGAGNVVPQLTTTILEAHAQYDAGPWTFRGLYAAALIDDAGEFNTNTGNNLAERLEGYYVEAGFDVLAQWAPETGHALTPFFRWEQVDTQAGLPGGFAPDPSQDETILTFGVNYQPIDQIVVKADYEDFDKGDDRFNVLVGYVF